MTSTSRSPVLLMMLRWNVPPWVIEQGGILVDESASHRMLDHVPLVIPEINPSAVDAHQGLIASPNCSTTQLVMCLKPILDQVGLKRVVVSTYQAASGAGQAALDELHLGTQNALNDQPIANQHFELPLAMNLIPKIGRFLENGYTSEEAKMVHETRKILGLPELPVCVTCVRAPIAHCHSEAIFVETERPGTVADLRKWFDAFPGIEVVDDRESLQMPTPQNCAIVGQRLRGAHARG